MFSSPMNTQLHPARAAFSMKPGILWHSVSTCSEQFDLEASPARAAGSGGRRSASQFLLRAKLSSVMKNRLTPWRALARTMRLDVVGGAIARFAALHVDDGAETAVERAAAARIEARIVAGNARGHRPRQGACVAIPGRAGRSGSCRSALSVPRRCPAAARPCGLRPRRQTSVTPRSSAALHLRRQLRQHRDAAADVKATDDDRQSGGAELAAPGRARAETGSIERRPVRQNRRPPSRIRLIAPLTSMTALRLVVDLERYINVRTKHLGGGAIGKQAVQTGEARRRYHRATPLDDVTVGVVV